MVKYKIIKKIGRSTSYAHKSQDSYIIGYVPQSMRQRKYNILRHYPSFVDIFTRVQAPSRLVALRPDRERKPTYKLL